MAYSDNFPATRPVFQADFANGGRIDPRATFSRASTGTFFGTEKVLGSENLLTYSNPNNAVWNESNGATVSTNSAAAPDGTTTASSIVEDSANSQHRTFASINATSGQVYTLVAYLKANGRTIAQVATSGAVSSNVEFDLSSSGTATTRSGSPANSSISQIGSTGWYKCSFQVTAGSTATLYLNVYLCDSANSNSYTGDGTSGVYAWGCNVSTTGQLVHEDTSGQIARSYQTKLQTAASGVARFEHSATDGQSVAKGILIESQAQNLNTYSEDFSDSGYTKVNSSIQSNAAIAPDGTLTADLLVEDGGTSTHAINKTIATGLSVGSTQYAVSIFAKAAGRSKFRLFDNVQAGGFSSVFDLSNGTVESGSGTIEDCGNGWYRCTIIPTANASTNSNPYLQLNDGSGTTYTGNGYSGLLLWGLQLETGNGSGTSHSSSYIGTTSSTATRAAESLSMTDSSLFDNGGGTLYAEASQNVLDTYNGVFAVSDGTGANTIEILGNSSSFRGQVVNANSTNASFIGGTITVGQFNKHALTFSSSEASYYVNGSEIGTTDSSVVIPTVSEIDIGNVAWSRPLNGHVRKVALYSEPISETAAAAITS